MSTDRKTTRSRAKRALRKFRDLPITIRAAVIGAMLAGACSMCSNLISFTSEVILRLINPLDDVSLVATDTAMQINAMRATSEAYYAGRTDMATIEPPSEYQIPVLDELPIPAWESLPELGASIDYSPIIEGVTLSGIPDFLGLGEGPYRGVYVSMFRIAPGNNEWASWEAELDNGRIVWAESETCLIYLGYDGPHQRPLNLEVHNPIAMLSVFTDDRNRLEITGIELLLQEFSPQKDFTGRVYIYNPGYGGAGIVTQFVDFRQVRAERVTVSPSTFASYTYDFPSFVLDHNEGVTIIIPLELEVAGYYEFQVKISAFARASLNGEESLVTLTTGRDYYEWMLLGDPREFAVYEMDFLPINVLGFLVECP